jgi:hypothetical protein
VLDSRVWHPGARRPPFPAPSPGAWPANLARGLIQKESMHSGDVAAVGVVVVASAARS